jgi:hypothetical protein
MVAFCVVHRTNMMMVSEEPVLAANRRMTLYSSPAAAYKDGQYVLPTHSSHMTNANAMTALCGQGAIQPARNEH